MEGLADLVVKNLAGVSHRGYPVYSSIIKHVFATPPPFFQRSFGRRYFELCRNADWFANSLIANSALEGYGSTQIWKFSNKVKNESYADALRTHALDESKHSSMFISMLSKTFPGLEMDANTTHRIEKMQPRYSRRRHPTTEKLEPEQLLLDDEALDELIQVHITEIRALVLQFLLRPVLLTYAPEQNARSLEKSSDILITDEAKHIRYTADFFEDAAVVGKRDFLFDAFDRHVAEFNDLTLIELERDTVEI